MYYLSLVFSLGVDKHSWSSSSIIKAGILILQYKKEYAPDFRDNKDPLFSVFTNVHSNACLLGHLLKLYLILYILLFWNKQLRYHQKRDPGPYEKYRNVTTDLKEVPTNFKLRITCRNGQEVKVTWQGSGSFHTDRIHWHNLCPKLF